MSPSAWTEDVLDGYLARPIGPATLVRPATQPARPRAVALHVHGYNDYFFQAHVADFFHERDFAFFAIDLRRAGRSLREGDTAHFTTDIAEFGDDIDTAARAIADEYPGVPLIIHAHSTGALSAALWAADRPSPALAGLVFDSPFLAVHGSRWQRVQFRAVPAVARARPDAILSEAPSTYAAHLLREHGGRWDFDTAWKRPEGQPLRAGWLSAVLAAQARVAHGLGIAVPILVAHAAQSGPDSPDNPLLDAQDTVLDVGRMRALAPRLGIAVTTLVVEDGVHDLALSADGPRDYYFSAVASWLDRLLEERAA